MYTICVALLLGSMDEIVNLTSPKALFTLQDTLWTCRSWLKIPNNPNWNGYMALETEGNKTYQQNWRSSTTTRSREYADLFELHDADTGH